MRSMSIARIAFRKRVRGSNLAAPECDGFNKPLKEYVSGEPREGRRRHLFVCIGNDPTVTQDDFAGAKIGEAFLVGHQENCVSFTVEL